LALGVDRVEGERRLPGPGEPGDADERVPRQPDGDVLQVVLARAMDDELLGGHARSHSTDRTDVPLAGQHLPLFWGSTTSGAAPRIEQQMSRKVFAALVLALALPSAAVA